MYKAVFQSRGASLPFECGVRRDPPRAPEDRQSGYLDEFDHLTLFYDAHPVGDLLLLSGPPLLNLIDVMATTRFQIDGMNVHEGQLVDGKRATRSWLRIPTARPGIPANHPAALRIMNTHFDIELQISADGAEIFAGRRVLTTLSKDNDLKWIQEWARFYVEHHGTDAVLIYDNASSAYSQCDLLDALSAVPGLSAAVVVDWPYPYGPGAGPSNLWDSDFCQYGFLENARWRFLRDAAGVISCDIDELTLSNSHRTLYEAAEASPTGMVAFPGIWVDAVGAGQAPSRYPAYGSYIFNDTTAVRTELKWAAVPQRIPFENQWLVHKIDGLPDPTSQEFCYRHFRAISTGWKRSAAPAHFDPVVHRVDRPWLVTSGGDVKIRR